MDDTSGTPAHPPAAAYPAHPTYPAYPPGTGYPMPEPSAKSVAGLGIATQVMLAVHLLASIALTFTAVHERTLIRRIIDNPRSVTADEANDADNTLNALSTATTLLYVATGVLFIVWLFRARRNLDAWETARYLSVPGQAWTITCWLPIVNLFMPFVVARGVLRGSTEKPSAGALTVLALWLVAFDVMVVSGFAVRGSSDPSTLDDYSYYADMIVANTVITAVAAIPAILVVRTITRAQNARVGARAAATPWGA